MSDRRRVSIVVPLFNEEENVAGLMGYYDDVVASHPDVDFDLVVVDDGSHDGTLDLLRAEAVIRPDLSIVVLSRNFGSHAAISAGMDVATGDAVIFIGGDQQEPPELIADFLDRWAGGCELVWGIRERRVEGGALGRAFSGIFSRLLGRFSELRSYPPEGPSGFLADRQVIEAVRALPERNRNLFGLLAWLGFHQCRVLYQQRARTKGRSKWRVGSKVKLLIDSFAQFSFAPIRAMTYTGLIAAGIGFAYAFFLIGRRIFTSTSPEGWTTVVVVVLLIGGLQLVMLGVLGEYLWRTAEEARGRPLYVVREQVRHQQAEHDRSEPEVAGGPHP